MDEAAQQKDYSLLCAAASLTITHWLLIFLLRIHYTCLQPRGQTKRPVPDSPGQHGFMKKKTEICNLTNFPPGNIETGIFRLCVFPTGACQGER